MSYTIPATSKTPALIIYLLDVSASMNEPMRGSKRVDVVNDQLQKIAIKMVQRSTKGTIVAPRYRVAMYAYSSQVIDLLGGIKTIEEVALIGVPKLTTLDMTNTAGAFEEAERLLHAELPNLQDCPAPLVFHMTDGEYNGADPLPVVERIKKMAVPDGNVLVENVYIREGGLGIADIRQWTGVLSANELSDHFSKHLYEMSSDIPDSYRSVMREYGYNLAEGARMFLSAESPELVELGFAMSGATPVTAPTS